MKNIAELTNGLFSRRELPEVIVIKQKIASLPEAKIGDIFEYENGFWQGNGDIVIMPHAVRSLKRKGLIKDGKTNFYNHNSCKHTLCST